MKETLGDFVEIRALFRLIFYLYIQVSCNTLIVLSKGPI